MADKAEAKRLLNFIAKNIQSALWSFVGGSSNKPATWAEAKVSVQPYLDRLSAEGQLKGVNLTCDQTNNNDPDEIKDGYMYATLTIPRDLLTEDEIAEIEAANERLENERINRRIQRGANSPQAAQEGSPGG